ncbi:MAG: HAD family hydrolase, partial [Proteobacteria bacterium]|nr:HAD family hydrolase [Pseudomonadota bacterium]
RSARAGLVVGVLTGVTPREVLAPLADHVIDSIASFEDLLD